MLFRHAAYALILASCVLALPSTTANLKKRQDDFDLSKIADFDSDESTTGASSGGIGGSGSLDNIDFASLFGDTSASDTSTSSSGNADDFADLFSEDTSTNEKADVAEDLGLDSGDTSSSDTGSSDDQVEAQGLDEDLQENLFDNGDSLADPLPDLSEDLGLNLDELENGDLGNQDPRGGGRPRRPRPPPPPSSNDDEYDGSEDNQDEQDQYDGSEDDNQQHHSRPKYNHRDDEHQRPSRSQGGNRPSSSRPRYNGRDNGGDQQPDRYNRRRGGQGGQGNSQGGSCSRNGEFKCEGNDGFVQCNRGLWDYHACPANSRCQVMNGQVYCVPTGGTACNQNGSARCSNGGYDVCQNGKWVSRKCGTGQQCRLYNGEVFCDYPLNSGNGNQQSSNGGTQSGSGTQCQPNTMACNGSGYDTCVNGKWKYNACTAGTACKIYTGKLYCAPSQASNNVQSTAWNGGNVNSAATPSTAAAPAAALPYYMMPSTTITIIPPPPPAPIIITTGGGVMMQGNPSAMSMPVQYVNGNVQQQSLPTTYTGGVQAQANTAAPPPTYLNNVNSQSTTTTNPRYTGNSNTSGGVRQQSNTNTASSNNPSESWDSNDQPFDLDDPSFFNSLRNDNRPFTAANGNGSDRDTLPSQDSNNWNLNGTPDQMLNGVDDGQTIQDFSQDSNWNNNAGSNTGNTAGSSMVQDDQITQFNMFDSPSTMDSSWEGSGQVVNGNQPSSIDELLSNFNSGGGRQVVNQDAPFTAGGF